MLYCIDKNYISLEVKPKEKITQRPQGKCNQNMFEIMIM